MTRTMKRATRMKVLVHLLEVRSWLICSKAFSTFECIGVHSMVSLKSNWSFNLSNDLLGSGNVCWCNCFELFLDSRIQPGESNTTVSKAVSSKL